jgi:ferredoxin
MKNSTRAFLTEARRIPGFSLFEKIHGYIYLRWPYFYISVGTGEHRLAGFFQAIWQFVNKLFRTGNSEKSEVEIRANFADGYHGKVVSTDQARQLISVDQEITIKNLEQVIPYKSARDIVLRNPDHIVALECPCRTARKNPCLPMDVCLIIGEPFAGFVIEHHPGRSRRIDRAEAEQILKSEHERGHVHHAFFKDVMLGRFYAICNCCACCCGAMQAHHNGTPMLASSGYISQINQEKCIGCGDCVAMCQFKAISLVHGKAIVDERLCMGCGVCVTCCRQHAHSLEHDPSKGIPLEIRDLMNQAMTNPQSDASLRS